MLRVKCMNDRKESKIYILILALMVTQGVNNMERMMPRLAAMVTLVLMVMGMQ